MHGQDDRLWTVARIADRFAVPRHRVEYIIDTRGITPRGTAGIARVFDAASADFIGQELRRIDAAREEASRDD